MPKKKVTQKQKQKQSQKTVVNVKVGDTKMKRVSRPRSSAPVSRMPMGISLTLQGSNVSLPAPPLDAYNTMVSQADALRRQMALSGQLIPQQQTNDLLNRVNATNPFANISNVVPVGTLLRPEQLQQQMVDSETTQNAYQSKDSASGQVPLDQDWIRNVAVSNLAQSFARVANKIGVVEDVESIRDIDAFDSQNQMEQSMLQRPVVRRSVTDTDDLDEFIAGARGRAKGRQMKELKEAREAKKSGKPRKLKVMEEDVKEF
jgi:hypothetical protein